MFNNNAPSKISCTQFVAGRSTFEHQGINSVSLRVNRAVGKSEDPKGSRLQCGGHNLPFLYCIIYLTRPIITCSLYILNSLFKGQNHLFWGLLKNSMVASNQEQIMIACIWYQDVTVKLKSELFFIKF